MLSNKEAFKFIFAEESILKEFSDFMNREEEKKTQKEQGCIVFETEKTRRNK